MSSATALRRIAGDRAAGAAELVVERDGGGERGEAAGEPDTQVVECARAVAFEREDVLAGVEDRFDALAQRCQVRAAAALVGAAGAHDRRAELGELGFEVLAAEVLVADQDQHLAALALAARDQLQADELLVDLWGGQRERPGGAVGRKQRVQPKAPEEAAVAGAVAVVGGVGERVGETGGAAALDGLARARALDRRGIDEQHVVEEARTLTREPSDHG